MNNPAAILADLLSNPVYGLGLSVAENPELFNDLKEMESKMSQETNIDTEYLGVVVQPEGGALVQLQSLAEQLVTAKAAATAAEKALEAAQDIVKRLEETVIPEAMEQNGMKEFTTSTGLKITVKEGIFASINKELAGQAYAWLVENGHAALIDRVLSVKLGRGEDERAKEIHQLLDGKFPLDDKMNVHSQTLSAFVREQLKNGTVLPDDIFNIHRQMKASVELPKVKKR